jgi:hypothetical protein
MHLIHKRYWNFEDSDADELQLEIGCTFTGYLAYFYKYWFEKEANEAFERCCVNLKNILEGLNSRKQPEMSLLK